MVVIKRDGKEVDFNPDKIYLALTKANQNVDKEDQLSISELREITEEIIEDCENWSDIITIEEIQDIVEGVLMASGYQEIAKEYIRYRYERGLVRTRRDRIKKKMMAALDGSNVQNSNANLDEFTFGGRKFGTADIGLKDLALEDYLPIDVAAAHKENKIYIHDMDFVPIGAHNCLVIDFKHILTNGFVTRNGDVRPPRNLSTAMQQVAVIFQCQSQVQYGGVAAAHIDFDLAPFVKLSFNKHFKDGLEWVENLGKDAIKWELPPESTSIDDIKYKKSYDKAYKYAMAMTEKEALQSAQGLYHNLNTLESRAGSQLPFTSINFGRDTSPEGRLVTKSLLLASIDGIGKHHTTPIFPISIFQYKKGINADPGDPNYDLKQLAIESLSKRIYPNFCNGDWSQNVDTPDDPDTYVALMGCRTMLGQDRHTGSYSKVGRGNISPITMVLPKLGIDNGIWSGERFNPDFDKFWKDLDEMLELAEKALVWRYNFVCSQHPDAAPFMYKNGSIMDYDKCENNVEPAIKHGTNAIGLIGMAEMLQAMFGKNQLDKEAREFGKLVIQKIYDFAKDASERNNMNFSCYFTPAEGCCYTIMQNLKKQYGAIPNVTERDYLTNSIHVPVWENISLTDKINIESEFTSYGTGGCITYTEFESKTKDNLEALETVIDYAMAKDIPYFAINFPIDTCLDCGCSDDIGDTCPQCGSHNIQHLARVTGYLSTDVKNFNKGKQQEAMQRAKHSKYTKL